MTDGEAILRPRIQHGVDNPSLPADPPDWQVERGLFWTLRRQILRTTFRQFFRQSGLRLLLLATLTMIFWSVMYALFHEGFSLLRTAVGHPATLARTVHAVYNLFFLSLLMMIAISSGILFYGAVYRNPEVCLLLTTPARASRIALYKFEEATLLACWGFLLLGSPLLIAYGVVNQSAWLYYVLLLPFLISFAVIPAGVGVIGCLLLVSFAPRWRRGVLVLLGLLGLVALFFIGWTILGSDENDLLSALWLQQMLGRLRIAEQRVLPSWWLSTGLLEAAHAPGAFSVETVGFLCVLSSHALMMPLLVTAIGHLFLRHGYNRLASYAPRPLDWHMGWLDRVTQNALRPLSPSLRLLLLKDLRLFRRDPLQWSQFLLFFGLLSLYFFYVRRFQYGSALVGWMTAIGFMNLAVVGLILSTFTTRFVFPMISLEGQRFWILGTLPIQRRSILWGKFLFASLVCCVPCSTLILLSDLALQLWSRNPSTVPVHQLLCLCLGLGLSAMAVGLGARLPNLREMSPARIAAGFGGTLTLILSAIFVVLVVLPPAIPAYLLAAHAGHTRMLIDPKWLEAMPWIFGITVAHSVLLTLIVTGVSLRVGIRAFDRLEMY